MADDTQELLEIIRATIRKVAASQSYSAPGGRQNQLADMATLLKERRALLAELDAAGDNGSMASLLQLEDVR